VNLVNIHPALAIMTVIAISAIIAVIVITLFMVVFSVPWWGSDGFARLALSPAGRDEKRRSAPSSFARVKGKKEGLTMTKSAVLEDTRRQGPPDERGHGGNGPLERVTVNLIARASRALQRVVDRTGDSKTDAINRAIQVYAYLVEIDANGGTITVRETKGSDPQLLKMGVSI
jgi:hypothetical protein